MACVSPVSDPAGRRDWSQGQLYCWCCGIDLTRPKWGRWGETHHIVKPGRSDECCNYSRLCNRCHRLAEFENVREAGVLLSKLSLGLVLSLKWLHDPCHWNPVRLEALYRKRLPELEPVPEVFVQEYLCHRPHDRRVWERARSLPCVHVRKSA